MAIPGVSLATISAVHCRRRSRSNPPCIMQKRFWRSGYLCACIQRSSQRTERSMASFMRARSGEVVTITSSSCIMMSEPIEFCSDIECSGVRSIGEPSWGLRKRTPSSVTLASLSSDTIWKLPLVSATVRASPRSKGSPTHHCLHQSAHRPNSLVQDRNSLWASTCENVVWPCLEFVGTAYGIKCCLTGLEASGSVSV